MARPAHANSEAMHARLLQEARRLLETAGPTGLTVRKVATAAGVTPGTVRYYFGSREELVEGVLDESYHALETLRGEITARLPEAAADPGAFLASIVRATYRHAVAWRSALRLNLISILERGAFHPRRRSRAILPYLDEVAQVLSGLAGRDAGEMRLWVQTAVFVVVRYATFEAEELRMITGLGDDVGEDELRDHVEAHLVRLVERNLGAW